MATKDITDVQVCRAYQAWLKDRQRWPYEYLQEWTGQPFKVCYRAMERADHRGLIEYGVSLRSGWLTEKGETLVSDQPGAAHG